MVLGKLALKKLKNEKGFAVQDLLIAMFVLVLFLGIITAVYVNFSNTSYEIKLASKATEIMTGILDEYERAYYDDIQIGKVNKSSIKEKKVEFRPIVNVTSNSDTEKKISIKVEYTWKGNTEAVENTIIKRKETIKPQNSPNLGALYNVIPIKFVYDDMQNLTGHWERTNENDTEWYNDQEGKFAVAVSGKITWKKDSNGEDNILDGLATRIR